MLQKILEEFYISPTDFMAQEFCTKLRIDLILTSMFKILVLIIVLVYSQIDIVLISTVLTNSTIENAVTTNSSKINPTFPIDS